MPLLREDAALMVHTAILREVHVEHAVIPLPGQRQRRERQANNEEDVQNTEEDQALGDADDVAAVGNAKGNGVEQPEQVGIAREHEVVTAVVGSRRRGFVVAAVVARVAA